MNHLFTAPHQPATRFIDYNFVPPHTHRINPRRVLTCCKCGSRRWAAHMTVQVYYDSVRVYCKACQKGKT